MINIVGKVMLADIPRGCQDEYAAIFVKTPAGGVSPGFAGISGNQTAATIHVNLNRGAAGD